MKVGTRVRVKQSYATDQFKITDCIGTVTGGDPCGKTTSGVVTVTFDEPGEIVKYRGSVHVSRLERIKSS